MYTEDFLQTVWPTQGPYLLATPVTWQDRETGEPRSGFRHEAVESPADAAQRVAALQQQEDVYFALGSIIEQRQKGVRAQANIAQLRSFWLDIDIRPDDKHYNTLEQAGAALRSFCKDLGLPRPLIVDSGSGLHVYWSMDEDLDRHQWNHYAQLLKGLVKAKGLEADPSRTADCASVLRPAGSSNHKRGTSDPVQVMGPIPAAQSKQTLLARIARAAEELQVKPEQSTQTLDIAGTNPAAQMSDAPDNRNSAAAQGATPEHVPSNPKKVVSKCQQLLWQAQHADEVDEPQWYAMIGCLRHAERGQEAIHKLSALYSGYNSTETQRKIEQHERGGYGPSTCAAFDNARPGGCEGCPFAGKITTPLQLGREPKQAQTPVIQFQAQSGQAGQVTLPPPPKPFKRVLDSNGNTYIAVTVTNLDNSTEDIRIYEHDLYPSGLTYNEREGRYFVSISRYLPQDGWADFELPLGQLFDKRSLSSTLGDIGVMPDLDKVEKLVSYMIGYIQQLQKQVKSAMIYAQLGWRNETEFVLPDQVLSAGRSEHVTPSRNIINALSWSEPRGDLKTWKQVATVYNRPGAEALQFGFGIGFAAPLFQFTNYSGMLVSMVGEKGCGKSSAMMLANSIWGHKTFGWVDSQHDTLKAFYNKLGVLKNLPASYDEITNLEPDLISDLCYSVSKGQGRQRLERDGSAKENFGAWQTMMLTTANTSLHSRLSVAKADSSAEAVRVFEYYVPSGLLNKAQADRAFDELNRHFGLAGPVYAAELVRDPVRARNLVTEWMHTVEQQAGVTSGERFWSAAPACVLAGFQIANELNLTQVDLQRLLNWSVDAIKSMRSSVEATSRTGMGVLSDYLNSKLDATLAISSMPQPGKVPMISMEPRGEIRIRYESYSEELSLDRADFRRFCVKQSVDPQRLKEELQSNGILIAEKRIKLGKDTAFGHGQTWVWVLDMSNPMMGGAKATVSAGSAQEVAGQAIEQAQAQFQDE